MKIRASITTWLLLLVLFPTLPLVLFSVYSSYRYAEEHRVAIEAELVQRGDALASEVRDRLAKSLGYVQSLAISNAAKSGDIEGLYKYARRIQDLDSDIAAISLIDADYQMQFLTLRPFGQRFPTGEMAAVREVIETGRPVLSAPFKSPISDKTVIALGVPLVINGKVAYCLRAIISTQMLNRLLDPSLLPNGWIASLVGSDGILVARSHHPERFVGQKASPLLIEALSSKTIGLWDGVSKEGVHTRTILRPVGDWGWYLAMGVPKQILLEPLRQEVLVNTLGGLALVLVGIGAALIVSRRITVSLRETVAATKAVLQGATPVLTSTGISEIDRMRENLTEVDEYGRLLENKVKERTKELTEAKERVASFATQLEATVEAERQRISREVHDQIGAVLTGLKMILRGLPAGSIPQAQEKGLLEALDTGVATARRIAAELRPPLIDDLGLQIAAEQLLETSLRPIKLLYSVTLDDCDCLSKRQSLGAYRILQEACTNVIRHAKAAHFSVSGYRTNNTTYEIVMADDGVGMESAPDRGVSLGMAGMRERAELMGGKLSYASTPLHGLTLILVLPITDNAPADENLTT